MLGDKAQAAKVLALLRVERFPSLRKNTNENELSSLGGNDASSSTNMNGQGVNENGQNADHNLNQPRHSAQLLTAMKDLLRQNTKFIKKR